MHISAPLPSLDNQTVALSWIYLGSGKFDNKEIIPETYEQHVIGTINDNSNFFTFTYGINPFRALSLGANVNVLYKILKERLDVIKIDVDYLLAESMIKSGDSRSDKMKEKTEKKSQLT